MGGEACPDVLDLADKACDFGVRDFGATRDARGIYAVLAQLRGVRPVRIQTFTAGEKILSQGEEGDSAFQILEGEVEIKVGEGKKEKTLGTLCEGEIFGEMSLIDPGPRSATVVAKTDTKCAVTSYDEFTGALQDDPERAAEFMKTLVRRLRHMNEKMMGMDPKRRGLFGLIREWQDTADLEELDQESLAYWSFRYL